MRRIRQEGFVLDSVGVEAEVFEVGLDVLYCVQGGFCSSEVRMQGEVAEVGGDGVIGG